MFRKKSILFVNPDYCCSFALRDEFRKLGWRSDVYIPLNYPEMLLYRTDGFNLAKFRKITNRWLRNILLHLFKSIYLFSALFRYRYFLFYSTMDVMATPLDDFLGQFYGKSFRLYLSLARRLGIKILYVPSGCYDEELRSNFAMLDNGNVCNNCGHLNCDDKNLIPRFALRRRYGNFFFGNNAFNSTQLPTAQVKYKSVDLDLWRPNIAIPKKFASPSNGKIRITHSYFRGNRLKPEKNIKGSSYICEAAEKLKNEGYPVEYNFITETPYNSMRFYQAQADIIVCQLIYGWWGFTAIEGMALGKPVVCYLREAWQQFFFKAFPEYNALPVINATTENIYDVLKKLVSDKEYRLEKGRESRVFAERHFDARKNALALENIFLNL